MRQRIVHKPQKIVVQHHRKGTRLSEAKKWLISNYICQSSRIFMTGSNLGEVNQLLQMVASLWDVENTDPKAKRAEP